MYPLLLGLFLAISTYAFTKYVEKPLVEQEYIGDYQLNLIDTAYDAEAILFYIDQSAKYAVDQSLYDLGKQGGGIDCRTYNGTSLWSHLCFPDYIENYRDRIGRNLVSYFGFYPDRDLPKHNYEFVIDKSKVRGIALKPLILSIKSNKGNVIGKYAIKPSFSIDTGVDIEDIFSDLKFYVLDSEINGRESILAKTSACLSQKTDPLWACIKKASEHFEAVTDGYSVDFKQIGGSIYGFDISVNKKIMAHSSEDFETRIRDMVISFAIDFSQIFPVEVALESQPAEIT